MSVITDDLCTVEYCGHNIFIKVKTVYSSNKDGTRSLSSVHIFGFNIEKDDVWGFDTIEKAIEIARDGIDKIFEEEAKQNNDLCPF